jgi:hypothetical protein
VGVPNCPELFEINAFSGRQQLVAGGQNGGVIGDVEQCHQRIGVASGKLFQWLGAARR